MHLWRMRMANQYLHMYKLRLTVLAVSFVFNCLSFKQGKKVLKLVEKAVTMANKSIPFNSTDQESSEQGLFTIPLPTKISIYSVLLFWSLLGNTLVIVVVLTYDRLKTNFNYLIVNMAVSDLFIPLFALPLKIYDQTSPKWLADGHLGNALCKLAYYFSDMSPAVSSLSLVIIAYERLVLVVYPMKQKLLFTNKRVLILIAFTWIGAAALLSPDLYMFRLDNGSKCLPIVPRSFGNLYVIVSSTVVFFVPLAAITVIYTVMLYNLRKASKNVARILSDNQMLSRQRRNKKIFYMSIAIIVVFAVLWGPFFCNVLVFVSDCQFCDPQVLRMAIPFTQFLGFLNSAVNPCLYFIFLKTYRRGLYRLFHKEQVSEEEAHLNLSRNRSTRSTVL